MEDSVCAGCRKDIRRLESEIAAARALVTEQFRGRDEALKVALEEMKARLAGMNELRGVVTDQAKHFLRTETYNATHDAVVRDVAQIRNTMGTRIQEDGILERLSVVEVTLANWTGRLMAIGAIIAGLGGVVTVIGLRFFGK